MTCDYLSIYESYKALQNTDPERAVKLTQMAAEDFMREASAVVSAMSEYPFKPRPFGGNFVCYLVAELNYANDLYICSLITDKATRTQCEVNARKAYCDAYDLCGDPA